MGNNLCCTFQVEELQESAAASHRLSLTYCFTLILLILGMVLLHNTFAVMHKVGKHILQGRR